MWSLLLHGHWYCSGPGLEAIESFSHLKDTCVNRVRDLWLFLPLRVKEESFAVNKAKHPSSLLPHCWKQQRKGTERVRILNLLFWVRYLLPQTSGQVLPTWNNGSLWLINSFFPAYPQSFSALSWPFQSKAEGYQHKLLPGHFWSLGVPKKPLFVIFSSKVSILRPLERKTKHVILLGSTGRCHGGKKT